jgi:hypothetical protein
VLNVQSAHEPLDDAPASKKRKLPNGASLPVLGAGPNESREVLLEVRDVSFSLPQRKKLHLGIAQYGTDINNSATTFAIFTRNPATNEVDMEVPLAHFDYALRLLVPEKAARQYNFVLLPKTGPGFSAEPIIWTVNAGPLKSYNIPNADFAQIAAGPDDVLESALGFVLRQSETVLSMPDPDEFCSATSESHRKGEKAYHVKAFRGSKDGYLFFLGNGIFFGFKKPLAFFAFDDVESVSYTSVLQRTFNLNISYRASGADELQEVEFSMLDQADFPGIDAYVKKHELQDASLADARRAKKLTNGKANGPGEDDDRTELEKAQQEIEDEEDEDEVDYDPGSDGESEGSGSDDDEQYDREYEVERKKMKGKDLVKEELGSEAEDVSVTEDEDQDEGGDDDAEQDEGGDQGEEEGDEDEYDEEEEEEEEQDDQAPQSRHQDSEAIEAAIPAHNGGWRHESGLPDPDDEDQL